MSRAAATASAYTPRPDQVEAVMRTRRVGLAQARAICVRNFELWRDRPRAWRWMQTSTGSYVLIEDYDAPLPPLPWGRAESLERIKRVIAGLRRDSE
jgi:hypothetical protein